MPAVYLPPREVIELAANLDQVGRRYWALGQVPGAGAIYIDGVRVATLREWCIDASMGLMDVSEPYDQWTQLAPGQRSYKVSARGRYQSPVGVPAGGLVILEMQANGARYRMAPTVTRLNGYGDQFSIEAEASSVQYSSFDRS
jgi:hypothetical protein